jgi:hypothetical protein
LLAAAGAAGIGLIVTLTVVTGLVQPDTVCVTEYVPLADVVVAPIVGFCTEEVKLFGPDQSYESAPFGKAVRLSVCPAQIVELLAAVGAAGIGLIVTVVIPAGLVQPFTVCVREYVPLARTVTPAMVGFCKVDVNAFGPVQL